MAVHITPSTGCNLGCTYCYETADRERLENWAEKQYDIEDVMDRLRDFKERYPNTTPGLFGGEPLILKNEHIERIFKWIDDNYDGQPSVQTNGTLIDDEILEIFKKYKVNPGISVDGPPELNKERKASGEVETDRREVTDNMSERTIDNIHRLAEEDGISVGVIVVLHETNAGTEERFEKLLDFMDDLAQRGVSGHFNPAIPYPNVQEELALDVETLKERYLRTWEWMKEEDYRSWNPMQTHVDNLLGNSLRNCVNNKCDVFNTQASRMILGNGETSGCGKTWSQVGDGAKFLQGPSTGNEYGGSGERYQVLKQVPGGPGRPDSAPDLGGCKGCKYWNVCQGGCPSSGKNNDFRNRTRWCEAKYALYEKIEEDIRAIFPNIRLITDYPWNASLVEKSTRNDLDIKPFGAIRPGSKGRSSAYQNSARHQEGRIEDQVDMDKSELGFEGRKQLYENKYGEENIKADKEAGRIHADSDNPDNLGKEDEWERVE